MRFFWDVREEGATSAATRSRRSFDSSETRVLSAQSATSMQFVLDTDPPEVVAREP
jgi:hypothetical protein